MTALGADYSYLAKSAGWVIHAILLASPTVDEDHGPVALRPSALCNRGAIWCFGTSLANRVAAGKLRRGFGNQAEVVSRRLWRPLTGVKRLWLGKNTAPGFCCLAAFAAGFVVVRAHAVPLRRLISENRLGRGLAGFTGGGIERSRHMAGCNQ
jgi:hypothetical protein